MKEAAQEAASFICRIAGNSFQRTVHFLTALFKVMVYYGRIQFEELDISFSILAPAHTRTEHISKADHLQAAFKIVLVLEIAGDFQYLVRSAEVLKIHRMF